MGMFKHLCVFLLACTVAISNFDRTTANGYMMKTEESILNPHIGDNITLECVISWEDNSDFSLVTHIPQWAKSQDDMGEVIFEKGLVKKNVITDTGRYHATIKSVGSNSLSYNLTIIDIHPEDGGSYSCEVATQTGVENTVTHKVYISVPLDSLKLQTSSAANNVFEIVSKPGDEVFFETTKVGFAMCTAEGDSHPVSLKMVIGYRETELDEVSSEEKKQWKGNVTGLKVFHSSKIINTYVRLTTIDDGKMLKCIASVPGQSDIIASGTIRIQDIQVEEKVPPKNEGSIGSSNSLQRLSNHLIVGFCVILASILQMCIDV